MVDLDRVRKVEARRGTHELAYLPDEGELFACSYGGYVLPRIRPKLDAGDLWEMVGATTLETSLPVINRTLRASKVPFKLGARGPSVMERYQKRGSDTRAESRSTW